jgi:outer membrane protein OmpA-like peptidoglycan-associated protein
MGNHVAVAPGENLATSSGRALLAHELTHTMDASRSAGSPARLEPKKGEGGLGSAPPEEKFEVSSERAPENTAVLFPFDSASLNAKATKTLDKLARQYTEAVTVRIHAYASAEGDGDYNLNLSAHRAVEVKRYLESKLPAKSKVLLVAHGETSAFGAAENNRRAGIAVTKGVEDAPTAKKAEVEEEWTIDPSASEKPLADRFTLFPRLQPHLFLDDNLLGPRPVSAPQVQLVPPYQLNPLLPTIGANDIDWFAMQQSFRLRGVTLDTQWGDSIQSHFLYSYNWFRGFLSHDLAVKGANLATSFVLDDSLSRIAPNAIDRSNQEFKLFYPDEKHIVIPLSSDSLYGIYRFLGGKNKDQYMFRF